MDFPINSRDNFVSNQGIKIYLTITRGYGSFPWIDI